LNFAAASLLNNFHYAHESAPTKPFDPHPAAALPGSGSLQQRPPGRDVASQKEAEEV